MWPLHGGSTIDYYGVTFDHLVPRDDLDPEVLQINIIEMDDDEGEYANTYLPFQVDSADYTGKKVLAVPRCCQKRKGTMDRFRINMAVNERDYGMQSHCRSRQEMVLAYSTIRQGETAGDTAAES